MAHIVLVWPKRLHRSCEPQSNCTARPDLFGSDAEHSWPYLSGEWSVAKGYAPMPFDGILLGSRMMVCKEADTADKVRHSLRDVSDERCVLLLA